MSLLREYIRSVLLEEPGRSYHTPNIDPIDVMEKDGVRVQSYYDTASDTINVTIEQLNKRTKEWEEIFEKDFSDPLDADFWMRKKVEDYQRQLFSKDAVLTDQD
ncbi:hypothetical protein OAA09_00045 [bacterium]|nr:hypothetical protein [bacterium]